MKKIICTVPYLLVNAVAFYVLPLAIENTGAAMLVMLIGIPIICFVAAVAYGMRHEGLLIYSGLVALLFVPSIFIFYNQTAMPYILIYGAIAVVGSFVGKCIFRAKK